MKKIYISLSLGFLVNFSLLSQGLCPSLGPDQILPCAVTSTTLTANFANCPPGGPTPNATTSYGITNIPFAPAPVAGNTVSLSDDSQAGPFNIGFSFCFFGNTYTQFWIGSNGWVAFSAGQPNTFTSSPIPSGAGNVPKNCVMGPWQDWHPGIGGQIRYQTIGQAPCRRLVVTWNNVPMYSCTNQQGTFQIILYESTNVIENHITNKPQNCNWAGGTAVQGLHNQAGNTAFVVPGRNSTVWGAQNNAYRYTPNGAPLVPTLTWYQVGNPTPIGTGPTITVNPPPQGANYTCHPEFGACYQGYMQCMNFTGSSGPDTVFVQPGPPFITPTIAPPYQFCPNTSITLSTTQVYQTYQWSTGSTSSTITTNVSGPYTVSVIDSYGCTGSTTVNVSEYPQPDVQVTPIDPYICPGESKDLIASGGVTYNWYPSNFLNTTTGNLVTSTPSVNTTYTVVGTDANGCMDSMQTTVYLHPDPNIIVTSAAPGVCPGYSTQLQANGANTYSWSPATGLSSTNINNPTTTLFNTQTYDIVGVDANGCIDTANITILAYPEPIANFTAPVLNGCSPVNFNFIDNSTISNGNIVTYLWNIQGQGSYNSPNPSLTISNPGQYDVQLVVTSDNGCVDSLTITDYIEVFSVPTAGFTASPQPANVGDAYITFTNTSSPDAVIFNWDMAGFFQTGAPNPSYEFSYADTFYVTLTATTINGCSDVVTNPIVVEDISEVWIPNSFSPNSDGLNDTWFPIGRNLDSKAIGIEVMVFNRWGQLIYESDNADKPWNGSHLNSAEICPQGVYSYSVVFINEKGEEYSYKGHVNLVN
jgi:gliding motility-associated-like protein